MKISTVAKRSGIEMTAKPTGRNPNMADSESMDHWRCTFRVQGRAGSRALIFSMGSAHRGEPPEVADVLLCLALDASGADQSFEDWCADYGYDTDSRSAERTWRAVRKQTATFRSFFGGRLWQQICEAEE